MTIYFGNKPRAMVTRGAYRDCGINELRTLDSLCSTARDWVQEDMSVLDVSRHWSIDPRSIEKAIKKLEWRRLISVERRPGLESRYTIETDPSKPRTPVKQQGVYVHKIKKKKCPSPPAPTTGGIVHIPDGKRDAKPPARQSSARPSVCIIPPALSAGGVGDQPPVIQTETPGNPDAQPSVVQTKTPGTGNRGSIENREYQSSSRGDGTAAAAVAENLELLTELGMLLPTREQRAGLAWVTPERIRNEWNCIKNAKNKIGVLATRLLQPTPSPEVQELLESKRRHDHAKAESDRYLAEVHQHAAIVLAERAARQKKENVTVPDLGHQGNRGVQCPT